MISQHTLSNARNISHPSLAQQIVFLGTWVVQSVSDNTRNRVYDLFQALRSAFCDITHGTRGTICYGHLVLRFVMSRTRQGARFLTSMAFCACDIIHETRGTTFHGEGAICSGHWVLRVVISHARQGVRFVTYGHSVLRFVETIVRIKSYPLSCV